jgi:hypothetical protein
MNFNRVVWRDEERNRVVEIYVDYRASRTGVEIVKLRPTRVMLLSESGEAVRKIIHVRTQAGQRFLARQFEQRQEKVGTLAEQLHNRHERQDQSDELPLAV